MGNSLCRIAACEGAAITKNLCAAHYRRRVKGQSLRGRIKRRRFGFRISITPEYRAWTGMWTRCTNKKDIMYHHYGGRGITVCAKWDSFEKFLKDMGHRPSKLHSIDRINNDRGYSKNNCRWSVRTEQIRNRRNTFGYDKAERVLMYFFKGWAVRRIVKKTGYSPKTCRKVMSGNHWTSHA